ncbi:MAG TPA: hypothetical protein VK675_03830, partial [Candidatus Paceibacterota bacterium]|nr:hypothetical protein [Candidatus Paceibacterota bacterium]
MKKNLPFFLFMGFLFLFVCLFFIFPEFFSSQTSYIRSDEMIKDKKTAVLAYPPLDILAYDKKLNEIANNPPPPKPTTKVVKDPKTGEVTTVTIPPPPQKPSLWPVNAVYPNDGAILPFWRIVAYYGNLYSTKMGVLGEYPEDEMLARLDVEVKKWEIADPNTPVIPALQYIAVVAQGAGGADGKYRARMPENEINKVLKMAAKINALVILDLQVGLSDLQTEVPLLKKYLQLPNVHVAI